LLEQAKSAEYDDEKKMQVDDEESFFEKNNLARKKRRKLKGGNSNAVDKAMEAVKRYFRPEFVNRLSDICVFNPLHKQQLRKICSNQMNHIADRLGQHGISLEVKNSALDYMIDEAYEPEYGARPLQRYVENVIITPISTMIISGEASNGDTVFVTCNKTKNELAFLCRPRTGNSFSKESNATNLPRNYAQNKKNRPITRLDSWEN